MLAGGHVEAPRAKGLVRRIAGADGVGRRRLVAIVVVPLVRRTRQPAHRTVGVTDDHTVADLVDVAHAEGQFVLEAGAHLDVGLRQRHLAACCGEFVHVDTKRDDRLTALGRVVGRRQRDVCAQLALGKGGEGPVGPSVLVVGEVEVGDRLVRRALVRCGRVTLASNTVRRIADVSARAAVVGVVAEVKASVAALVVGASALAGVTALS